MVETDSLVRCRGRAGEGWLWALPLPCLFLWLPFLPPWLWVPVLVPLPGVSTADSSQPTTGACRPNPFLIHNPKESVWISSLVHRWGNWGILGLDHMAWIESRSVGLESAHSRLINSSRFCLIFKCPKRLPSTCLQTLSHLIFPVKSFLQEMSHQSSEFRIPSPPFTYQLQPWASYLTSEPRFFLFVQWG